MKYANDAYLRLNVCNDDEMSGELRLNLVGLLTNDVLLDGKLFTCARAIDMTVQSLTGFLNCRREDLLLPQIVFPKQHRYE